MSVAAAQQIEGYSHKHWNVAEGSPADIRAIAQTRDGFLWLGTSNGLYRFDGLTFEKVEPAAYNRRRSNQITALAAAPDGALWVGYDYGGVGVYRDGRLTDANATPRAQGYIASIAVDSADDVWVAAQSNFGPELRHWHRGRWQIVDKASWLGDQPIQGVFAARDGTLWIAQYPDILRLPRGAARPARISANAGYGATFAQDQRGDIWLLSSAGLKRFTSPARAVVGADAMGAGLYGLRTALFEDGIAWIAGNQTGMVRQSVDDRHPALHETIPIQSVALFRDREGTIWGGGPDGLVNYVPSALIAQPIEGTPTTGFATAPDGTLYVGTDRGVYQIAHGVISMAFKGLQVNTLCAGPEGLLLAATGDSVHLRRKGVWKTYPEPARFVIGGCAIDSAGDIWASAVGVGIFKLTAGGWKLQKGWPQPRFIVGDDQGHLFASQPLRALMLLVPGASRTIWKGDDIAVGYIKLIKRIGNYTYIGGEKGLARYDGRRFEALEALHHPWLSGVSGLVITKSDAWIVTADGIARVAPRNLDHAFAVPHQRLAHDFVGTRLGVSARSGYIADDAMLDSEGHVWFVTNRGIFLLDPDRVNHDLVPPPVTIRGLVANNVTYQQPIVNLPAGTSRIQFDYVALSLVDPARNSYRYRLDGVDPSWIEAGARRQASYTALGPGSYRFQVMAANSDGIWNRTGAAMTIVIAPFFWQTWWFKAGLLLFAAVLLWAFVRWRIRVAAEATRNRIGDRLAVREHIAQELHDTLLQGFQGLVLRFQSIVERLPRGNIARTELEATLERADDVLQDARDRVRFLRERTEPVDLAPMLSKIAEEVLDGHLAWSVNQMGRSRAVCAPVADDIDRIAGEALFNALRHSQAKRVAIQVFHDPSSVSVVIADDGVGIEEEVKKAGQREGHYGLVGMRERASRLGATLDILDGKPSGTEIRLTIPARIAYR